MSQIDTSANMGLEPIWRSRYIDPVSKLGMHQLGTFLKLGTPNDHGAKFGAMVIAVLKLDDFAHPKLKVNWRNSLSNICPCLQYNCV